MKNRRNSSGSCINQGARIATFTWNYENELGYPNYQGDPFHEHPWSRGEEKGLKKKGIEVLNRWKIWE